VISLGLVVVFGAACGGSGTSREAQNRSIAQDAGLPAPVGDFFALAARGADATYTESVQTNDAKGNSVQITTTQRPPDRRLDVFNADGTIDATIATGGKTYQCTQTAGTWMCGELGPAPSSSGGVLATDIVQRAVDEFRARAADYDFAVDQRTIANAPVSCLVTTRKPGHELDANLGATATLCLSHEGVPLYVDVPAGRLTAVAYATSVDPHAFDLPAPVSASGTASAGTGN
jgi:hypothetical protein